MGIIRLLLVRHGEAAGAADGDHRDATLTPLGQRQSALVGARLAGAGVDVVRHSPLPRAARTASLLAAHLPGVPVRLESAVQQLLVPGPVDRAGRRRALSGSPGAGGPVTG